MMDESDLKKNFDIYREIGSIGSGNAATALSQMINMRVTIEPVKTQLVPIEEVPAEIGGAETMVMAIYQRVMGDLTGDAVYLHSQEYAKTLIRYLTSKTNIEIDDPESEDVSAYKEMANIFTGAYLNAISSLLGVMIVPSIPHYATDMLGSLIDAILAELGQKVDRVLLIKTEMTIDYKEIGGGYLMIFNPDSMERMVDLINRKYDLDGSS